MTSPNDQPATTHLDRSDSRLRSAVGIKGLTQQFLDRVRSGELGLLPVAIGLLVIATVFSILNPVFLAPNNLVNLLFDAAAIGFIALGIVCVLLLGEIDLSVGSMSGLASALIGVLWVRSGLPLGIAIIGALTAGALVGLLYGILRNRFGMPSFVATLAGLLTLLGLQLYLLGPTGSINLPFSSPLVRFGQLMVMPAWLSHLFGLLPGTLMVVLGYMSHKGRKAANLSSDGLGLLMFKALVFTIAIQYATYYLNLGRGVPWMFGMFVLFVVLMHYALTRTQWGRFIYAIGGNVEAARRAGIKVERIRTSAFVMCSMLATTGGILSASRLASSSQQAGTADVNLNAIAAAVIGGTSLFGGRGTAWAALFGVLVIQAISNGLTLLNLSSSLRYMITGGVLAIAVIVDSMARQSRANHGRS
ncbi:MAG: hypothetical protein LAT65_07615 [Saccharospirillum sp.]|nr:hypothetical protein [Saccharospirillum sp.]